MAYVPWLVQLVLSPVVPRSSSVLGGRPVRGGAGTHALRPGLLEVHVLYVRALLARRREALAARVALERLQPRVDKHVSPAVVIKCEAHPTERTHIRGPGCTVHALVEHQGVRRAWVYDGPSLDLPQHTTILLCVHTLGIVSYSVLVVITTVL